jgi:hypothetical protein
VWRVALYDFEALSIEKQTRKYSNLRNLPEVEARDELDGINKK